MKRIIIISSLILFHFSILSGQERPLHSLSLGYGLGSMLRQDLNFSPFVHSDISPLAFTLSYDRERRWSHGLDLKFTMNNASLTAPYSYNWETDGEEYSTYPHSYTFVDLNYYIGRKGSIGNAWQIEYGLASINKIQATPHTYGWVQVFGYFASFGLNAWGELNYSISDKSRAWVQVSLPFISWACRSPYLVHDDVSMQNSYSHKPIPTFLAYVGDGKLVNTGSLQTIDLELGYAYSLSEKWSLGLQYNFEFIRYTEPNLLASFRNSLFVTGQWKF